MVPQRPPPMESYQAGTSMINGVPPREYSWRDGIYPGMRMALGHWFVICTVKFTL